MPSLITASPNEIHWRRGFSDIMAFRVLSCLLLMAALFPANALSKGGKNDNGSSVDRLDCTQFFCRFLFLNPCFPYAVTGLEQTGSIDLGFSSDLSNCSSELNTGQALVSAALGEAIGAGVILLFTQHNHHPHLLPLPAKAKMSNLACPFEMHEPLQEFTCWISHESIILHLYCYAFSLAVFLPYRRGGSIPTQTTVTRMLHCWSLFGRLTMGTQRRGHYRTTQQRENPTSLFKVFTNTHCMLVEEE